MIEIIHGHVVSDPYRWLEDPASDETRAWQAQQEVVWRSQLLPDRDRFRVRIDELSDTGVVGAPVWRAGTAFRVRRDPGRRLPVLYADDRVVLDPEAIDPGATTLLDAWHPSPDGKLVACQLSRGGDERSELYVLDAQTGALVDGPIGGLRHSPVAWLPGGDGFYYVRDRRARVHRLDGDDLDVAAADGIALSADGRWLTLSVNRGPGNDVWLCDLVTPARRVVQQDVPARSAVAVGGDGRAYMITTLDAPRGRLLVADPAAPGDFRDLVPEDGEAVIADFALLDGVLLVAWVRHAIGEISVHDPETGERQGAVPLPGLGSIGRMSARDHEVWFTYSDYVTPESVYRYDARTGETTLWEAAPGRAELPEIESHQVVYQSADGTPVRMVVLGKGLPGPRPCILYGYGGFGVPLTPSYSSYVLPWLEAGGVFAFAQVRGGGEEGEAWHRAGMRGRKQNSFDDFAAAAETLIAAGWTTPGLLGVTGESGGGLLVGALVTQRPELVAAAVCSAPVLDMIRFEKSGLGSSWVPEYGSADDPEQFAWLLAYSPYHHVKEGVDYPATLFTVFDGDSRVDPLHARKMCAALQGATSGVRPILFRHETGVGHAGRSADRAAGLAADMLAFLARELGGLDDD
ncbi:S9 family peptidase [Herbidospora galbida]|uniref:prolyl oligopeptidase n=1 Tax=Herbidospora galbida TaxID=2575442 RepID=A0A4U3MC64_9ACTN|nr:prolyl oligopeptidase family serine peptidase [Herbidospora galbida]TKK86725.1 S9 family peptidase [Herbidospora galbida]